MSFSLQSLRKNINNNKKTTMSVWKQSWKRKLNDDFIGTVSWNRGIQNEISALKRN